MSYNRSNNYGSRGTNYSNRGTNYSNRKSGGYSVQDAEKTGFSYALGREGKKIDFSSEEKKKAFVEGYKKGLGKSKSYGNARSSVVKLSKDEIIVNTLTGEQRKK